MTVTITTYGLEMMGFREPVDQGAYTASFMSVIAYEARGIVVPNGFVEARLIKVAGAECRVAISDSVNTGCKAITGDDFADTESDWRTQVKSDGPFVLIGVGPTNFFDCNAGRMMRSDDGSVTTYDSFPQARSELANLEQRVLPRVLAALTCALNDSGDHISLRKLQRASAGRSPDGAAINDHRIDVYAQATASRRVDAVSIATKLDAVRSKATSMNEHAARFVALASSENDQLKKFLYFFLALEVETHAVFGRIDHLAKTCGMLSQDLMPPTGTVSLLKKQVERLTNIYDRFVWCATCVWTDLLEEDVALFKKLKDARDAIAHGRASEPPPRLCGLPPVRRTLPSGAL